MRTSLDLDLLCSEHYENPCIASIARYGVYTQCIGVNNPTSTTMVKLLLPERFNAEDVHKNIRFTSNHALTQ